MALIGPTASGKTALSLELAERLGAAEIISVDSRQVYRYMDVGTDKIPLAERRVPHHMLDVVEPSEPFSVSDFVNGAVAAAEGIAARGRVPLFVGGTPFYYNALFHASMNASLPHDAAVRRKWEELALSEGGREALHERLKAVDPITAARLHPNDVRRVSRALELWELTGQAPSRLYEGAKLDLGFDVLYIGLSRPRAELFSRINQRLQQKFASGFPEEVAWLIEHGFDERFPPLQGLGYRELAAWYRGKCSLEEALEGAAARTRAFCRRQMTWFGKFQPVLWYNPATPSFSGVADLAAGEALRHLEGAAA